MTLRIRAFLCLAVDISVRPAGLVASGVYGETDTMAIRTREKMQRKTLVCAEDQTLASIPTHSRP